jgi:3-hydroxyacyl-CoA dehydrogenase
MINGITNVVVLGSGGTIGSLVGGLVAQQGIKVHFLSRTADAAGRGLQRAIAQARSEVISRNIICGDYDHLFEDALKEADWIVECVSEDLAIKQKMYEMIDGCKRPDTIVSSVTSSLPLEILPKGRSRNFRKNFLSTHFYNPPGKMPACEITGQSDTDPEVVGFMEDFLKHRLRRVVIPVKNVAGFAGNRIAFLLLNRITALAAVYGVEMMDYLIGPYTGRQMPPLATIDLVGLDIHKAIIENLYNNTSDEMHHSLIPPEYVNTMIQNGSLGNKTPDRGGFYKKLESGRNSFLDPASCEYVPAIGPHIGFIEKAKHLIHMGRYQEAFETIEMASSREAEIVRDILCVYIVYSYSRIGEVTDSVFGIDGIDRVMSFGFNWAPPSLIVSMLGGREHVIGLLENKELEVPDALKNAEDRKSRMLDAGKYFPAR